MPVIELEEVSLVEVSDDVLETAVSAAGVLRFTSPTAGTWSGCNCHH